MQQLQIDHEKNAPVTQAATTVAVVIPCYRVRSQILDVIAGIGPEVDHIFVVDDKCPDGSGAHVVERCSDPRVQVVFREKNGGVGAAMVTGYREALRRGAGIVVKIDGDGQMNPAEIPSFLLPLLGREADYAKGNRFQSLFAVRQMPSLRLIGNAALSLLTKLSSGYWSVFDPTNGFTAIHRAALQSIDLANLSPRYFFESDMLIKLGDVRAVVVDVPMEAKYGSERSGLRISQVLSEFAMHHVRATLRRLLYAHFLRDFSIASISLVAGLALLAFGVAFGAIEWHRSVTTGIPATTGAVMISVLPIVLGFQMLMFFLSHDILLEPRRPLQRLLRPR